MLDGYGLHSIVWNQVDERFGEVLVASAADAVGRGISLAVRRDGVPADLTGAAAYLVWKHRVSGKRGTVAFEEVDASEGTFVVYYPTAMCGTAGAVDAQVMLSLGEGAYVSSRVFTIRVEPVLVNGEAQEEDGFTLFVGAMDAYEHAGEIATDAAIAANAAAELADQARADLLAAAANGDFDGKDGFSPSASVTQTAEGATITITDRSGTTTADIARGARGDKGDTGPQGPKGDKGDTGERGPQGVQGEAGPKGDTGATGADGADGVSCTHSWNGTVLSVTSASGTSSADLVGPQWPTGATGATGPQGPAGADGTTFTPASPLDLTNGVLSIDLSDYLPASGLPSRLWIGGSLPGGARGTVVSFDPTSFRMDGVRYGDWVLSLRHASLSWVTSMTDATHAQLRSYLHFTGERTILPTTALDLAKGQTSSFYMSVYGHGVAKGSLLLNTSTGALMEATASTSPPDMYTGYATVYAKGLGNIFNENVAAGATYTAASPLSIDANDEISIDLSAYAALAGATFTGAVSGIAPTADANFATKKYVDDAIAALDDLSGVSF